LLPSYVSGDVWNQYSVALNSKLWTCASKN